MSRTKRWTVALACALLTTALSGCGGDGDRDGDTVSAREYLRGFCSAARDLAQVIEEQGSELQGQLASQSSPEDVKDSIVSFISEIVSQTETMISEVENAGVPEVENGEEIAASVLEGLEQVGSALEDARSDIEDLSTDNEEQFAQDVRAASTSIGESTDLDQSLGELNTDELDRAREEVDACQEIPEF